MAMTRSELGDTEPWRVLHTRELRLIATLIAAVLWVAGGVLRITVRIKVPASRAEVMA